MNRHRFINSLKNRFSLRLRMPLILLAILAGWAMHHCLPEASRMMDVIHLAF
jgi:hypothetical protein